MRAYWAIFSARARVLLQYRAAAAAGFGTQLFWGLIRMMFFTAFYESADGPHPMTLEETITYIWLGQAMLVLVPWWFDGEIEGMIRNGTVAYELARPVDLYWLWYARSVAMRGAPTLLRSLPMFLVAGLFLGLGPPASAWSAVSFAGSVVAALLLSSALTMLVHISLFWFISSRGLVLLMGNMSFLLTGMIVPIPLLPDWARTILNALPYRGVIDVPFRLYMGHIPPVDAPVMLTQQLAWVVGLIVLGRWLIDLARRRLVVQGG